MKRDSTANAPYGGQTVLCKSSYTANMYSGRAVEKHFFAVILRKNTRISLLFDFAKTLFFLPMQKVYF